jgi:hypothetical protein
LAAERQRKNRVYRVAVLAGASNNNPQEVEFIEKVFKSLGWTPGRDLEIEYRRGAGNPELLTFPGVFKCF